MKRDEPLTAEQQALVAQWYGLVYWFMKRRHELVEWLGWELVREACLFGLILAAKTWSPERGKFSGWAVWYFRSKVSEVIRKRKQDQQSRRWLFPLSLDRHYGHENTLGEDLPDQRRDSPEVRELPAVWLAFLPPHQQQVIRLRFERSLTYAEAARELGCSDMNVHRIEQRALARLRGHLCRREVTT